jgi:hypothetical protein
MLSPVMFRPGKVTNTDVDSVAMWIEKIREIHPPIADVARRATLSVSLNLHG